MASSPEMINIPFVEQEYNVLSQLNGMRLQHQLCDVTVRAGEQEFHCHQAVLAASSGHFHSIFVQGVLCLPKKPSNETLDLSFVSPEVFTVILDFIYTANLNCPAEIVGDVLKAAKMLEIPPLIKQLPVLVAGITNKVQRLSVDTPQPPSLRHTCSLASSGMAVPDSLPEIKTEPDGSADHTASTSALRNVVVKQELSPSPLPENELIDYYGQEGSPVPWEEDGQDLEDEESASPSASPRKLKRGRPKKGESRAGPSPRKRQRKEKGIGIPELNLTKEQQLWVNQTLEKVDKRQKNCPECQKVFSLPVDMRRHLVQVHSPEPLFHCEYCQVTFRTWLGMSSHERQHKKEEEGIGVEDGTPRLDRTKHEFTEEQKQWIKDTLEDVGKSQKDCPSCDKVFDTPSVMRKHLLQVHSKEPLFSCNICSAKLRTSSGLRRHSQTHIQDKQHVCPMCAKTFSRRDHLVKHVRIHTGEKPFKCPDCDRRFRTKWEVTQHKRYQICYTKGPFICKHCGVECRGAPSLQLHEAEHSEDKQFECEVCGKGFALEENLKRHLTEHADIPSIRDTLMYKCTQCPFVTTSKQNLKHHDLRHKGERSFKCDFCGKGFLTSTKLKRHKNIHKSEMDRPHH